MLIPADTMTDSLYVPPPTQTAVMAFVRAASTPRAIVLYGCWRVPGPAMLPIVADTYTHCATTPSLPSQLSSVKLGSIASASETLLHVYSHPHTPVDGLRSRSYVPAGQVAGQTLASPPPSFPGEPSAPPSTSTAPPAPVAPPLPDVPPAPVAP